VFTAKSLFPFGDIAIGRTCPLSNSVNGAPVDWAVEGAIEIVELAAVEGARSSAIKNIAATITHNTRTHPFTRSRFL
jgi:hypothetical protein